MTYNALQTEKLFVNNKIEKKTSENTQNWKIFENINFSIKNIVFTFFYPLLEMADFLISSWKSR